MSGIDPSLLEPGQIVLMPNQWHPSQREWFAGLAMQGILASWPSNARMQTENTGGLAVEFADALIAALNAEPQS